MTGLKKLVVKCDPAILPASAFANLSNLTDVTIETGAIPANLFAGSGVTTLANRYTYSRNRRERLCQYSIDRC